MRAFVSAVLGTLMAAVPASAGAGALDAFRWERRLVVVSAPSELDPRLLAQRRERQRDLAGWRERALRLLEVVDGRVLLDGERAELPGDAIRAELDLGDDAFAAVLVGYDGGVKARQDRPFTNMELFGRVDGMPMRRQELSRGG